MTPLMIRMVYMGSIWVSVSRKFGYARYPSGVYSLSINHWVTADQYNGIAYMRIDNVAIQK